MIYPDRAQGVKLVTDRKAMQHSLRHAPTLAEGKQVYRKVANTKRGDRYIQGRQFVDDLPDHEQRRHEDLTAYLESEE